MKNKYIVFALFLTFEISSCVIKSNKVNNSDETIAIKDIAKNTTLESAPLTKYIAGEKVYEKKCKACHQANGKGIANVFPPLANSDYLLADRNRAIKQIIEGSSEEMVVNGETYNGAMAPQNLENQEIVDVMNYILNSWKNEGGVVTLEEVQSYKGIE
jgi:mono/diheme cytochrome c family protein